jgi:putative redox protein
MMKFHYTPKSHQVLCTHVDSGSEIVTVAPKDVGGSGSTFSPTDLVGVALASCILITVSLAAKKIGYEVGEMKADVEKVMTSSGIRRIAKLVVRVFFLKDAPLEIRSKLEKSALQCPVHASLHPETLQEITFSWG